MVQAMDKRQLKKNANAEALETITAYFETTSHTQQSKHLRVRGAILEAIFNRHLQAGDQIPPEQELSAALAVSLGTVQRALRELSQDGTLVREHGRGTFVAEPSLPNDEVWQFRFRRPGDDRVPPVSSVVLENSIVEGPGRWSDALGPDENGFLKVVRIVSVSGEFDCYNEIYFRMSRFGTIREFFVTKPRNINVKTILTNTFNAPTLAITQMARVAQMPPEAHVLGLSDGTVGMEIDAVGHSYGKEPIFLQRIWFPQTDYFLDMTHREGRSVTPGSATRVTYGFAPRTSN